MLDFTRLQRSFIALACMATAATAQSVVRPIPGPTAPVGLGLGPAATSAATSRALARWERLSAAPQVEEGEFAIEGFGSAVYLPDRPFSNAQGELGTQRAGWGARFGIDRGESGRAVLEVGLESSFYDFGGTQDVLPGVDDPFNDVYETRIAGATSHPLSDVVNLQESLEVRFAGGDETQLDEGVTIGGALGLSVAKSAEFEVGVGLAASSRLEDDALLIPYVSLDWRPNERLHLRASGPEMRLDWRATERIDVGLEASYAQRQFRLNDTSAGQSAAFRDEQIDLGAELGFRPFPGARLSVSGGYVAWREITLLNDGVKLFESELEPQPYVGLGLSLVF